MNGFEAALYGLVQGITEYLPVSSSAHLVLLPKLLGQEDPGLVFDVFLHAGTLLATLLFFWKDWAALLRPGHLKKNLTETRGVTLLVLIIATLPGAVSGYLLQHWADSAFRGEGVIVFTQLVGGILLYVADRYAKTSRPLESMGFGESITIGFFQCLALVPGMSRSGSTMTGARMLGFDRAASARFSFLLSAPITGGAILYEMVKHGPELFGGTMVPTSSLVIAFVVTFVSGIAAIGFLLKVLRKVSFLGFALYRIALSIAVYLIFRPF